MVEPRPHVAVARKAARWIRTARIETPAGVAWPADPERPESVRCDLYGGNAGVVLFHLELHLATGEASWLEEARRGADELVARLPDVVDAGDPGLYTGLAGIAFVLEETFRAAGEPRHREGARRAVAEIRRLGARDGEAYDLLGGSAGVGLLLLWAAARFDTSCLTDAAAAGRRLLDAAVPAHGGLAWDSEPGHPVRYPNFAHGTAGVSFFLARLHRATGDRAFLDGALAGARSLEAVADRANGGLRLFHHEPGGESLFYLGWCHGPAGTARLFRELGTVTGDPRWEDLVRRSVRTILESGAPERRLPGFWNNVGQCCGDAGVGELLLSLDRSAPDPALSAMTRRLAASIQGRATEVVAPKGPGLKWVHAEHRLRPELLAAQTGYMQGAAGIGSFFLHLDAAGRGASGIAWPDGLS